MVNILGQEMGGADSHWSQDPGRQEHAVRQTDQARQVLLGHQQLQHQLPDIVGAKVSVDKNILKLIVWKISIWNKYKYECVTT